MIIAVEFGRISGEHAAINQLDRWVDIYQGDVYPPAVEIIEERLRIDTELDVVAGGVVRLSQVP